MPSKKFLPSFPEKEIYGLLGYPVKHSFSPAMHNAAFCALAINAEYRLFEVDPENLGDFLHSLTQKNICGLNVTIPYKEKVFPFLKKISSQAELIGAVNTLKVTAAGLDGFNTDGEGFLTHLKTDLVFNPQGKNIAIFGAGGAARAVSVYLCKEGCSSVAIYDTNQTKAHALISHLTAHFNKTSLSCAASVEELRIKNVDLLINATPFGMKEDDPLVVDKALLHKNLLVYDLIYNPKETKLLKAAKESGARISNGLGMLLYQGMIAFEIWTGKKAPKEVMIQALLKKIGS